MNTVRYIFAITDGLLQPSHDHCSECGGEEYEGDCGKLKRFLVVETPTPFNSDNIPCTTEFGEKTVCEFCANEVFTEQIRAQLPAMQPSAM